MNGMIFAAGLGTRLRPLTAEKPKALVEVCGQTLLSRAIGHLVGSNIKNIVVNVHHFADMIIDYVETNRWQWDCDIIISDEREQLMDTGGGLRKTLSLWANADDIVVCNADVVCNVDLCQMIEVHRSKSSDATLLVSGRKSSRALLWTTDGHLAGWRNFSSGEEKLVGRADMVTPLAFNGFHVVRQDLVWQMPSDVPFPIIDEYLRLAKNNSIMCYQSTGYHWFDVGTIEKLKVAEEYLCAL